MHDIKKIRDFPIEFDQQLGRRNILPVSTKILEIDKIKRNKIVLLENLKASIDIFSIDPIKYKISEKIKKSFDPKRILNPGKMYSGI